MPGRHWAMGRGSRPAHRAAADCCQVHWQTYTDCFCQAPNVPCLAWCQPHALCPAWRRAPASESLEGLEGTSYRAAFALAWPRVAGVGPVAQRPGNKGRVRRRRGVLHGPDGDRRPGQVRPGRAAHRRPGPVRRRRRILSDPLPAHRGGAGDNNIGDQEAQQRAVRLPTRTPAAPLTPRSVHRRGGAVRPCPPNATAIDSRAGSRARARRRAPAAAEYKAQVPYADRPGPGLQPPLTRRHSLRSYDQPGPSLAKSSSRTPRLPPAPRCPAAAPKSSLRGGGGGARHHAPDRLL